MRQRQASAHHSPDESHYGMDGGHQAEDNIGNWLDEMKRFTAGARYFDDETHHAMDRTQPQSEDEIFAHLADRVKALGQTYTSNQHGQHSNHNYDEDARRLIEGIKARSRAQNYNRTPPDRRYDERMRPQSDRSAERLMEMLDTIAYLEEQLDAGTERMAPSKAPHARGNPGPDRANMIRLQALQQKLESLEAHLEVVERQKGHDDKITADPDSSAPHYATKPRRKSSPSQGRKAFRRALEAIAETQNESDASHDRGSAPVAQSAPQSRQRSTEERREQAADQRFSALIEKIDALQRGTPDVEAIRALKAEFAELRQHILASNDETSNAKAEIRRLRDTLQQMQETMASALDANRVETLETDVNRIAEFLLQSPDLTALPGQTQAIAREIGRLSDSLLTARDHASNDARESGERVIGHLEKSLNTLKGDLVGELREIYANLSSASALPDDLAYRLSDLREHSDNVYRAISHKFDGVEHKVATVAEQLSQLGRQRGSDPDMADKMAQMENRLIETVKRLEKITIDQNRAQADRPAARLQMPAGTLTSDDLRREFDTLKTHFSETVKAVKAGDPENLVTAERLKAELNDLAVRLGSTAPSAEPSAHALTPQKLKYELRELAEHLTSSLKTKSPVVLNGGVNDDTLKSEIAGLGERMAQDFANERSLLVNHIDNAISKLQSLADARQRTLEDMMREAADKVSAAASEPASSGSDPNTANIKQLEDGINGLKHSAETLSVETRSSFESVRDMLENVSGKLNALEENGRRGAPREISPRERREDAMDLTAQMRVETADPNGAATLPSASSDEMIMQRMREHVKSRQSEARPPHAPDDRVKAKSDAQKPSLMSAPPMRHEREMSQRARATETHSPRMEPQPAQDTSQEAAQYSKADFITAARRAAQMATSERLSHQAEQEEAEAETRSTLSALRERLSSVQKFAVRKKKSAGTSAEEPSLAKPSAEESSLAEPSTENNPTDWNLDISEEDHLQQEMLEGMSEPARSSTRVKVLSALLAVGIIGAGYAFIREPVADLIAGLQQDQRTIELSRPPAIIPTPGLSNPQAALPETASVTAQGERGAQVIDPQNAPRAQNETPQAAKPVQEDAPQAPNTSLPATNPPAVIVEETGVDRTITQAISRQVAPLQARPQAALDPLLRKALDELPKQGISAKLANALIAQDSAAFIEIARRFGQGDIFEQDLQKAAFWYQQAAEKENAVAQYRLGTLYEEGIGVRKNVNEARRWYERATTNGNARAMHNLAVLYTEGAFGEPDFKEAFKWFERSASYGVKDSQFNLGILYVRGLGVEASLPQAYKWFDIVAKGGDLDAAEKRDEVAKALKADQLEAIQKESAAWTNSEWIASANVITPSAHYWRDGSEQNVKTPPSEQIATPYASSLVKEAQILLNSLGFDTGEPDGLIGKRTKDAVKAFEYELGLPQTGKINQKLVEILKAQRI